MTRKDMHRKLSYVRKHLHEIMHELDDNGDYAIWLELLDSACGVLSVVDCCIYYEYEDDKK